MAPTGGEKTPISKEQQEAVFQTADSVFSPGVPLKPPNPQPVRQFDFAVGANLSLTPRAYEPFGFPALRAFSNVELVRLAIETRKDQIERLEWQVKPREGRRSSSASAERIATMEKFWRKPDGEMPFGSWLRKAMEDLLSIDAPAFERRRNRNGELIGLDVIPGDTIKPLIDDTGRRPRAPAPAYQQIIKGRVWTDLTSEDLLYVPRNPRPNHLYGFSPVEQIIVTINIALRRQAQQLAWFADGNAPPGMINTPEGWTPDQLKDMQTWMDARLSGNQAERSKIMWAPFGSKYQAFKDPPLKDEHDEWLARVVCFCFSLPPTAFIKQLNRSTSESSSETAMEEGLFPLLLWWKRVADSVIQDDFGFADLEWAWKLQQDVDAETQAEIIREDVKAGLISIDEGRAQKGLDPTDNPATATPMVLTPVGYMPVEANTIEGKQATLDAFGPPVQESNAKVDGGEQAGKKPVSASAKQAAADE